MLSLASSIGRSADQQGALPAACEWQSADDDKWRYPVWIPVQPAHRASLLFHAERLPAKSCADEHRSLNHSGFVFYVVQVTVVYVGNHQEMNQPGADAKPIRGILRFTHTSNSAW